MAFKDFLSSLGGGLSGLLSGDGLGAVAGLSNSAVSLTGLSDEKKGFSTAITGGAGAVAGVQGALAGIKDLRKEDKSKVSSGFGILGGGLAGARGIADIIGGYHGMKGEEGKKAAGTAGVVSGILGALSGASGAVSGGIDLYKAWNKKVDGKRDKKELWRSGLGLLGGLANTASGIAGAVSGYRQANGYELEGADTASGWLGVAGGGLGALSSFIGGWGNKDSAAAVPAVADVAEVAAPVANPAPAVEPVLPEPGANRTNIEVRNEYNDEEHD